ncbi:MAG TPA: tail fiber protein [Hyphomonas sp.]|nr:tail fiber protein [Hyphomonas sp.]
MPQIDLPSYSPSRTRTRTYDVKADPAEILAALSQLLTPTGTIIPTLSGTEPGDGWKLCNGQTLLKFEYPDLYAVIGGAFGETADTFDLPDLTGRMLIGSGGAAGLSALATGGAHQVSLTVAQMPSHSHDVADTGHSHGFTGSPHSHDITDPGHVHTAAVVGSTAADSGVAQPVPASGDTGSATTGIVINSATAGGTIDAATTGVSVQSAGSGDPVQILPPVLAIYWMVRT